MFNITSRTHRALATGALAATAALGLTTGHASAHGASFEDLPSAMFPDVNPCTGEAIVVSITSQLQVVPTGRGEVRIFRSTTTSSDGGSGRGIETRVFVGDRHDINLRLMVSGPDGHRYSVVGNIDGTGDVSFRPPTLTCLTPVV